MNALDMYQAIKPLVPRLVQIKARQVVARYKRRRVGEVWPILESAGRAPAGWPGWPAGGKFALVLTHDVETRRGLERCRVIMNLEERLGFRSAFYFVPERYPVPADLRAEMIRRGFEIGIHGLRHDLSLFRSRAEFMRQAQVINRYLKDWGAVGFRAPYMIRNLEWIRDGLTLQYDTSTFDTDPFEPQPDGVGTIFPFLVGDPAPPVDGSAGGAVPAKPDLVELPCTLSQDLNLFVLLGETTSSLWKTKLNWIARQGGLAMLSVHPDYVQAGPRPASDEYPLYLYAEFLEYIRTQHAGQYWHALPREVAGFWRDAAPRPVRRGGGGAPVIWIDLDNTPHVPFFRPVIRELRERGYEVLVTARDAFQVCDLARRMGVACIQVGRHHGKNRILKLIGLFHRAFQLRQPVRNRRPVLAVSHGSRAQLILANRLGIPSVLIEDYEFAQFPPLMRPTWRIVPEVIPPAAVGSDTSHVLKYPGIKEDVYTHDFQPDPAILDELGLRGADLIAVVRPPATEAHYHNPESEALLVAVLRKLHAAPGVRIVLLPRNRRQGDALRAEWPQFFVDNKTLIPGSAVEGLNLLWHADLVVSGGGTMNREAAALGIPVYSIFRGKLGAVDRHLAETGRLVLLTHAAEVETRIQLRKRPVHAAAQTRDLGTLRHLVDLIEYCGRTPGSTRRETANPVRTGTPA